MAEKEQKLLEWGRKLLGSILQELRKEAGLTTKFAASPPLQMRDSMIRMVENGYADLPMKKIPRYAAALNSKAQSGWSVDPEALALAYASLRAVAAGERQGPDERFNWKSLYSNPENPEYANAYVRRKLAPPAAAGIEAISKTNNKSGFDRLNPIQLQMVNDIARRITVFGSDIVTEAAIIEWESQNVGQIKRVLAAVISLGSELEEGFLKTIADISAQPKFSEWRYLVATNDQQSFVRADEAFRNQIKQLPKDQAKAIDKKFTMKRITVSEFQRIGKVVGGNRDHGWDAFYLYNVKPGPDLLLGVFRRSPPHPIPPAPLTTEQWGCTPVNEALPWSSIAQFTREHDTLWEKPARAPSAKSG